MSSYQVTGPSCGVGSGPWGRSVARVGVKNTAGWSYPASGQLGLTTELENLRGIPRGQLFNLYSGKSYSYDTSFRRETRDWPVKETDQWIIISLDQHHESFEWRLWKGPDQENSVSYNTKSKVHRATNTIIHLKSCVKIMIWNEQF